MSGFFLAGMPEKKASKAASPPAEAPIPTMGKHVAASCLKSSSLVICSDPPSIAIMERGFSDVTAGFFFLVVIGFSICNLKTTHGKIHNACLKWINQNNCLQRRKSGKCFLSVQIHYYCLSGNSVFKI